MKQRNNLARFVKLIHFPVVYVSQHRQSMDLYMLNKTVGRSDVLSIRTSRKGAKNATLATIWGMHVWFSI
jgi:hypothetical protein